MQIVWLTLLAAHLVGAILWLWRMPAGFPQSSTLFWVDQVAPWVVAAWAALALGVRANKRVASLAPPLLIAMPVFWSAFGVSAHLAFPTSSGAVWAIALGGGLTLIALWLREHGRQVKHRWLAIVLLPLSLWAGWRAPLTQRAADPSTLPAMTTTSLPPAPIGRADTKIIKLSKDAQLRPGEGRLVVRHGDHLLTVQPFLSLESRSPDRTLASLAPPPEADDKRVAPRTLDAVAHDAQHWSMHYHNDGAALDATITRDGAIQLDAYTEVLHDVFSHRNTFTELAFTGHKHLSIVFSPVPALHVEVPAFTERAHFAYLDDAGVFHIVEAKQFQKGPFVELGAGKLAREQPLVLQVYDGDQLIYTARFDDWAQQASTALSPTAGWGVAANVVLLQRSGERPEAPVLITLSLAATEIGSGDQTVGYQAGVYRNRLRIETRP